MTKNCTIRITNEVHAVVENLEISDRKIIEEKFAIFTASYRFNPLYKLGRWDGRIRYFKSNGLTYLYLLDQIIPAIKQLGYKIELVDQRVGIDVAPNHIDENIYQSIPHQDTGEPTILRDYQVRGVNSLIDNGFGILLASTGAGKAQPLTAGIITPQGKTAIGNLTVGSEVITATGDPAIVSGVFDQGITDVVEIAFDDLTSTQCDYQHLWLTFDINNNSQLLTAEQIEQQLINKRLFIPLTNAVNYQFTFESNYDPYVIGVIVGDNKFPITSVNVQCSSTFVQEKYEQLVRQQQTTFNILKRDKIIGSSPHDIELPFDFTYQSVDFRYKLIQGILDQSGIVKQQSITVQLCNQNIVDQITTIIHSLGYKCQPVPNKQYTITIKGNNLLQLLTDQAKIDKLKPTSNIVRREIISIVYQGKQPTRCIMVDHPDHLYLTDNFIVTHNTIICTALVDAYGKKGIRTITIVPNQDLIKQTKHDYVHYNLDVGEYSGKKKDLNHQHVISTWQSLIKNPQIVKDFQLVLVDECHGARGSSLQDILVNHSNSIMYRFGVTGTLPKDPSERMMVHIALGPVRDTVTAKSLIDIGVLAKPSIEVLQLEEDLLDQYELFCSDFKAAVTNAKPISYKLFKQQYFGDYSAEKSYMQKNTKRLKWIAKRIIRGTNMRGNSLVLVDSISFARKLSSLIPNSITVNGQDAKDPIKREKIYQLFKDHDDLVVIATVHIAGTGISIRRIFNLVMIDLGKSFIRVIQGIGRSLRTSHDKQTVHIDDICSDLKYGVKHLKDRLSYYNEAQYQYQINAINYTKPQYADF